MISFKSDDLLKEENVHDVLSFLQTPSSGSVSAGPKAKGQAKAGAKLLFSAPAWISAQEPEKAWIVTGPDILHCNALRDDEQSINHAR